PALTPLRPPESRRAARRAAARAPATAAAPGVPTRQRGTPLPARTRPATGRAPGLALAETAQPEQRAATRRAGWSAAGPRCRPAAPPPGPARWEPAGPGRPGHADSADDCAGKQRRRGWRAGCAA